MACPTPFCRIVGFTGLLVFALCLAAPQTSEAQVVWSRTAHVVTPVESRGPVRAFLDTLLQVEKQTAGITVRNAPDQTQKMKMAALRDTLQNTYGLDVTSADHVMVGYRFSIADGDGFKQEITDLHFFYRGTHEEQDIPLLYLNTKEPWVESILRKKGMPLQTNLASFLPFREQFRFLLLTALPDTDVVEVGGRVVRNEFDAEKRALIQQVYQLGYYSDTYQ